MKQLDRLDQIMICINNIYINKGEFISISNETVIA